MTKRVKQLRRNLDVGRRINVRKPKTKDSFLVRICHALDEPPRMLAQSLGVQYSALRGLLSGGRRELVEIDRDEVWYKLASYVSLRIGALSAIKWELDKALQKDKAERAKRIERFKATL